MDRKKKMQSANRSVQPPACRYDMDSIRRISELERRRYFAVKRMERRDITRQEWSQALDESLALEKEIKRLSGLPEDYVLPAPTEPVGGAESAGKRFRPPARRKAKLIDGNGLTRRDRAVLRYLQEVAKGSERVRVSNHEIAYATGYKRRSVQLATAALHHAGKALKRFVKVQPTFNLPNEYVLPENRPRPDCTRPSGRPENLRSYGCKKSMQKTHSSTLQNSTSKHINRRNRCNPSQGGAGEFRPAPPPRPVPVRQRAPEVSAHPDDIDWLKRGLKRIGAADFTNAAVEPQEHVFPAIRDVLREIEPDYPEGLWNAYLRKHGVSAYYAVLETAASHKGFIPRPDGRGPLRNPGGYLSGILRKSSDDCRPDVTVSTWITVDERRETPNRVKYRRVKPLNSQMI